MTTAPHSRIADVEALRAWAILMVLVHHARSDLLWWGGPWKDLSLRVFNGRFGVDLFLVVSGFVIGRSLLPALASARGGAFRREAVAFWLRRFWRLIPSAWLWLAVPLLLCVAFNDSGVFGTFRGNLLAAGAGFLQVANFFLAWAREHLDPVLRKNSVFVYWSLSLEEQFYLLLPLLVLVFRRRLTLVLVLAVVVQLLIDRSQVRIGHLRTEGLFTGVLLAIWEGRSSYRRVEPVALRKLLWRLLFLAANLVLLVTPPDTLGMPGHGHSVRLLTCTALVWAASYDRDYVVRSPRLMPVFAWLGARSYSLYLIHVPAFFFVRELFHRLDPSTPVNRSGPVVLAVFCLTASALVLVVAELNFRYVETPMRRRGRAIADAYVARRRGAAPALRPASPGRL